MEDAKVPAVIADDVVVTLDYALTVNGDVIDSSEDGEPIMFIQGQGHIISGLEQQIYGMKVGESRKVVVQPAEGYGEIDPEAFADVPRKEFPPDFMLAPGMMLEMSNDDGEELDATVVSIGRDSVRLDFNHPLAGKVLNFAVTVVELREASPEEIAHGHVHDEGLEYDEEDDEEFFLDLEGDEEEEE